MSAFRTRTALLPDDERRVSLHALDRIQPLGDDNDDYVPIYRSIATCRERPWGLIGNATRYDLQKIFGPLQMDPDGAYRPRVRVKLGRDGLPAVEEVGDFEPEDESWLARVPA